MTLSTYPKGLLLIIHENHLEQCLEHVIWSINVHYYYSHVYSKQRIICRLFFFQIYNHFRWPVLAWFRFISWQ